MINESHQERSAVLFNSLLERILRPVLSRSFSAMTNQYHRSYKFQKGIQAIEKSRRTILTQVYYIFRTLKKIEIVKPWQNPAKQAKLKTSQIKAGLYALRKRSLTHHQCIKFASFVRWKNMRGQHLECSLQLINLAPDRPAKHWSVRYLSKMCDKYLKYIQRQSLQSWYRRTTAQRAKPLKSFPIDSLVLQNQANILSKLDLQLVAKTQENTKIANRIKLFKIFNIFYREFRKTLSKWKAIPKTEMSHNEDVLFDYIRYLEEQTGASFEDFTGISSN